MKHFILDNARRYNYSDVDPVPNGASFNDDNGFWTDDMTGNALIISDGFQNINTKKADRETGEDQKGE